MGSGLVDSGAFPADSSIVLSLSIIMLSFSGSVSADLIP